MLLQVLTNPVVSFLLLSVGMLGIVFEVKHGAFGLGGLLSIVTLGVLFGSSFASGLAGWEVVLLLGLGMIALAVELFVLPGFGVAGVLGLLAVGAATVLALAGTSPTGADIAQALAILGASLVITTAVIYAWLRHLPSSGRFAGLFLTHGLQQSEGYVSTPARSDLIGMAGVAVTDLRPAGTAKFGAERVDVVTEGEYVAQGTAIEIVRSEGYRHIVRATAAV